MFSKILTITLLISATVCEKYTLQRVLILSRHNVRTPLAKNLGDFTTKSWPKWKEKSGYLTEKGALLEGYMGEFFSTWLYVNGLVIDNCPSDETFFVYANTAQRTMASAEAFVKKAFPNCNKTIHHTNEPKDVIFNAVIHNSSAEFKTKAIEEMQHLLKSLHLNPSYEVLEDILKYNQSKSCLSDHHCNMITDKNKIMADFGLKPNLEGPLKICKSVVDSFIMENYEGFPDPQVAWGLLKTETDWSVVLDLSRGYHSVIFNTSTIAPDVAHPLITFIRDILIDKQYKASLLMGHDANIYTLLKSLEVKPYILKFQHELVPAGGKVVFQKWVGENSNTSYLKLDYIYQSTQEMRDGRRLSLDNPPEFTNLELEGCEIDEFGLCLWDDFIKILDNLVGN